MRLSPLSLAALGLVALAAGCAKPADSATQAIVREPAIPTTTSSTSTSTTTTAPFDPDGLRPPAAATDPAALAAQIAKAESLLRDPASDPEAIATAALLQQVTYRQLGVHPEWDDAVRAALPEHLHSAVAMQAAARREFRGMHKVLATEVPAWEIVAPAPAAELMAAYREAEATFGIPWRYLAAINLVETGLGRIRGTSTAGAQGPMQFMPATWAAYGAGGDINNTRDAILGAGRYLAANNGATDIDNALYRYNHSDNYVRGVKLYADLIVEHPGAFDAFYRWGIWYTTDHGDLYLPVGYRETARVPVAEYLAR